MATNNATLVGCQLLAADTAGLGARKTYLLALSFPDQFTGSADSVQMTGVAAKIQTQVKNGKTLTLSSEAINVAPGIAADGTTKVYASSVITNSSGTLAFDLVSSTGADINFTSASGVTIAVTVEES